MIEFEDGAEKTPAQKAWDDFQRTGDIFYYLAYKKLMEEL